MSRLASACIYLCLVIASASIARAIKCHVCDPLTDDTCLPFSKTIDCSTDVGLGHAFDSCYTLQIVISDAIGINITYEEKNCSIHYGCLELRDSMCMQLNETTEGLVKSCNVDCCTGDFCNGGKPDFTKVYGKTSTHWPDEREPTIGPRVLARDSSLGVAVRHTFAFWSCATGVFISLLILVE